MSAPQANETESLPPRPVKPTRALVSSSTLGITPSDADRAEHYSVMLDYWIAEARWQTKRADLAEKKALTALDGVTK